ncbi:hypothetical protein EDB86DRAFT_2830423 [Lactarius hatsudake]|nr:hypothetical protein EDB86DRAFT_2830423 [Lactarius hatsudake]
MPVIPELGARTSVCTPPPPPRAVVRTPVVACALAGCGGASSDKWDFGPSVRLPRPSINCVCVGGRSVSEPKRSVHGDEAPALSGVTGVSPADSEGASLDGGGCRCNPLNAPMLTVSGRENVTVFECAWPACARARTRRCRCR